LFNLFFTQVLKHAVKDLNHGISVRYRMDGSLFDLRRLSAKTKTFMKLPTEALFADDCALMAHEENHLQMLADKFSVAVWSVNQPWEDRSSLSACTNEHKAATMHHH
jgi:hypothetical protein